MILPSLYNPHTVVEQNGSTSLIMSLITLFLIGSTALAALFNPLVILSTVGGLALIRVGYAIFKGE